MQAVDEEQKQIWVNALLRVKCLLERTRGKPLIPNQGTFFDHYRVGEVVQVRILGCCVESRDKSTQWFDGGVVRKATHIRTGNEVWARVLNKSFFKDSPVAAENFKYRLSVLRACARRLRHASIVRCYEVYEDPFLVYLVFEAPDAGNVLQFFASAPVHIMNEANVAFVIENVASALQVLHRKGLIHRHVRMIGRMC